MDIKYDCYKCKKENTYKKSNRQGGGELELLMELKTINIPKPKEIVVKCEHCSESNTITIYE